MNISKTSNYKNCQAFPRLFSTSFRLNPALLPVYAQLMEGRFTNV